MSIRNFSSQLQNFAGRTVDNDAPEKFRLEFIDLAFYIFEQTGRYDEERLFRIITQSLGIRSAGKPWAGFRHALGRDISDVDWPRVYDLICRLWSELPSEFRPEYQTGVNRVLAAYHIAWDLGEDGELHRVLPYAAQSQVEAAFKELNQSRFAPALTSFQQAMSAYDDRPQRGREACKNIFDALESVAKEIFSMPTATFGHVLAEARKQQSMSAETLSVLQKLYDMANNHFRHGMTTPFTLKSAEVDFVFVSCIAAILFFVRL
ncbi:MAG TPA: hypothetical protein VMF50_11345 [Candidatus Binataceae bacterium]|nr:hypothetical protein [Candidatus Binataceae bacterium]